MGYIFLTGLVNAETNSPFRDTPSLDDTAYLESRNQLEDYILDTGDEISIEFINVPEFSGSFEIDAQGEIYLKRIKKTYVRGLTILELTKLLEKRFAEFLYSPEIYIKIIKYKPIRIFVSGEVRRTGFYKFNAFAKPDKNILMGDIENKNRIIMAQPDNDMNKRDKLNFSENSSIKRSSELIATISNAIKKAGGLTSYSDISQIQIIRDVPIGRGGGKKRAEINFLSYINKADDTYDIRIFDGDEIFVPRLQERDVSIIPKSILSGLSPRFISVSIGGQIENPGTVKIPIEGSLSDVMNLTGPRKPLSGRIYLIRYNQDGTLLRENITYSSTASPGSRKNPFLLAGDLITVKNSILGRASGTLKAITEPFVGIYATKEVVETITGE